MKSKAISESIHSRANDVMKNFIFPALRDGRVKETIRHDKIIIVYGNGMSCKYRSQHHFSMIRNRLIRMAKILIKIGEANPSVKQFADILKPQMYDSLIDVINSMGEYDERTENYRKPTLPTEIGTSLKYVIQLYVSECIKNNDLEAKTAAKNLLYLLKTSLPAHVNKTASESLLKQKRSKNVILPSTSDIETLNKYVIGERNEYHDKLKKQRPGELERSLLTDLDTLSTIEENTETYRNLKKQDKAYVKEYGRSVIRGKLARGVPVLLHKSMKASLRLVLQHRGDARVLAQNTYIFGLPQAENGENVVYRYLSATGLMRRYSVDCGASDPKSLRATAQRKHVATKSISLNLDSEDLQQLQG
ncbi:hypothetical protein JTB14_024130 [Gonioctena quinquepunctata]|nr:hypothetical protein JTB14_024130 [Gonioctena quinquepunctata]